MPLPTTATHKPPSPPAGEQGRPAFVVAFPHSAGLALSFDEPLGREWLAEAGVDDVEVSGAHIELRRTGAHVELRDVGSRNGTRVDGRPLAANRWARLVDGAVVVLGTTVLVFRKPSADGGLRDGIVSWQRPIAVGVDMPASLAQHGGDGSSDGAEAAS